MELNSKLSMVLLLILVEISAPANALKTCGGSCNGSDDCQGKLACISGKCNDDPKASTQICSRRGRNSCRASSYLTGIGHSCNTAHDSTCCVSGKKYPQYHCSPPVTAHTPSSGWYDKGMRCGKKIRITAANGRSVFAKVVDECDSVNGCDSEHDYQPPCPYNDVDASPAVWEALGLNSDDAEATVTWSDT